MFKKLSRLEWWSLQQNIKHNRYLNQFGSLYYSANIEGSRYKTEDGKVVAYSNKDGYFALEELLQC